MPKTVPKRISPRFEIPDRLNIPADRLQKEIEWLTKEKSVPPQITNAIAATVWFLEVEAFREQEEEFLASGRYEQSLSHHRATISMLIAKGEQVIFYSKKFGIARTPANFTVADLQATLNSLHTTFRCQHGPKNPSKTDQLIDKLLNGAQSQNH